MGLPARDNPMQHIPSLGAAGRPRSHVAPALASVLLACVACHRSGGRSPVGLSSPPVLESRVSYTDDDVRHFLVRTHFGITNADLDVIKNMGLPAYIDEMLEFPHAGTREFERHAKTILYNPNDPPGLRGGFPSKGQLIQWWLRLIERNPNPFQEVMALFWHDHFAVSAEGLNPTARYWMREHVDYLREHGAGNVRTMLIDVARGGAMLNWLDGIHNTRQAPNENFAREFWELFTLGAGNGYTQTDVTEAARAFTGYDMIAGPQGQSALQFYNSRHDLGTKNFLGGTIVGGRAEEYEEVVDITLQNAPAAEFLCTKLFEHFCYPNPTQGIVDELAAALRSSNWELKPVLKMLLESNLFYSAKAKQGLIKSPVEHAFGFIRSTGMQIPMSQLVQAMWNMGQVPTRPPTVEGWLGGSYWLSAQDIVERANVVSLAISSRAYQTSIGFQWSEILPPKSQSSAPKVVDALVQLLRVQLTDRERRDYIDYLDTEMLENGTVISSPFVGSPQQLDERVRGLLYILAQHPTYMVR